MPAYGICTGNVRSPFNIPTATLSGPKPVIGKPYPGAIGRVIQVAFVCLEQTEKGFAHIFGFITRDNDHQLYYETAVNP